MKSTHHPFSVHATAALSLHLQTSVSVHPELTIVILLQSKASLAKSVSAMSLNHSASAASLAANNGLDSLRTVTGRYLPLHPCTRGGFQLRLGQHNMHVLRKQVSPYYEMVKFHGFIRPPFLLPKVRGCSLPFIASVRGTCFGRFCTTITACLVCRCAHVQTNLPRHQD